MEPSSPDQYELRVISVVDTAQDLVDDQERTLQYNLIGGPIFTRFILHICEDTKAFVYVRCLDKAVAVKLQNPQTYPYRST